MAERDPRYFKVYQDGDDRELEQKIQDILESGAAPGIDVEARESIEEIQRKIDSGEIGGGGGGGGAGVDSKAREDIQKVTTQLAEKASEDTVDRKTGYYWIPEKQPSLRTDESGTLLDIYKIKPDQIINDHFEPIRTRYPDYMTRQLLGKDASETYDIWKYELTPKDYKKTVIIASGMHGSEVSGIIAMLRFVHYLTSEYHKYPQLSEIRENVRIVFIPILNPWGMAQTPRKRQNSNGVDLNRNSNYKWDGFVPSQNEPFGHDYKGTAPFSEVEAQYLKGVIDEYQGAASFLDFHNTGAYDYDFYVSMPENYPHKTYEGLVEYFSKGRTGLRINLSRDIMPSFSNYAYHTYGIPASTTEWNEGSTGGKSYSSQDFTSALAWFSNSVIKHAREFEGKVNNALPILRENYYTRGNTNLNINVGTYREIEEFHFEMDAPFDGLMIVTGSIVLAPSDLTSNNFVCPVLVQTGTAFGNFNAGVQSPRNENYALGTSRLNIPFQAQQYVVKSQEKIRFGLFAYTSAGTTTVYRYRVKFLLLPADGSKAQFKMYSAIGKEGQGYNAMTNVPF